MFSDKVYEFDDLLEKIDFTQELRILRKWRVISGNLPGGIEDLINVRNQLAHRWSEREVFYKVSERNELPIAECIDEFKEDAESIGKELTGIYIQEQ